MNNYAIARVFSRIADLMEITGENPFKARAYRTAAQTMQDLTESLEVLAERGELQSIPGVGEAIAAKTRDIIATGTTKLYEKLKEQAPESLAELLSLPGFGAKKIHAVWKELGVSNLDELEAAAREGRLKGLAGFGPKTEASLVEAIVAHRRRRARTPIHEALPYAEGLRRSLLDTGVFERVELAGSLRRWQDSVGDINFVAIATDRDAGLNALATHAEAHHEMARSETWVCVQSYRGMRLAIAVVSPSQFGGALVSHTGSQAHLQRLRMRAQARGLDLDGEGLWRGPEGVFLELPDEEAAYAAVGLTWIPPELREDRGEITAAESGSLPGLIEAADIRGVLHAHSTWSDGAGTIAQMAAAAHALGHEFLAITDHSKSLSIANGLDPARLMKQAEEIAAVNATYSDGFRVLRGLECDILVDGELDLPPDVLRELDFVIGSVHMHQRLDREAQTARVVRALESGVVDLLAHPTGRLLGHRDSYDIDLERVFDAALAHDVALEINAYPDRLDLNDVNARAAAERGLLISINPDAHRAEHLSLYRYGIGQARRAWLTPQTVINTWPREKLLEWLARRRGS